MKIRIVLSLLVVLLLVFVSVIPAFAHSGRTDSNGGHYDHSTGEYHYHNGSSSNQNENNNSSNSKSSSTKFSNSSNSPNISGFLGCTIIFGIVAFLIYVFGFATSDKIKENKLPAIRVIFVVLWLVASLAFGFLACF